MRNPKTRRFRCDSRFERRLISLGFVSVAGVDEAGRGSLFGPVFASAVVLPRECRIQGLRDSKELEAERREELAEQIRSLARCWAVASASADEIDRINILQASRLAMKRAVEQLSPAPDFLLVDAVSIDFPLPQRSLIKGDARCRSIAAASILAKVHRDACMCDWDVQYPQYGFRRGKGYATPEHLLALETFGATPLHRFTFEPVRRVCSARQMDLALAARAEDGACP